MRRHGQFRDVWIQCPLGGCFDSDVDFDGVRYHNAWSGTPQDAYGFSAVPSPIRFTGLKFRAAEGEVEE